MMVNTIIKARFFIVFFSFLDFINDLAVLVVD
jgi:hypothetical protein